MKKRIFGLSKTAAAVQILGMGLLFLISCNNILAPSLEGESGDGGTGTALVSFGNGVEGARTLLPSSVSFQRYDLTCTPAAGNGSPVSESITSGASVSVKLAAGTWNIHVDGFTSTGGNYYKVAEGDSEPVTISGGQTREVTITLSAVSDAGTGTLSIDISGENGIINYGFLSIYNGHNFDDPVDFYNGEFSDSSAYIKSSGLDLDIPLSPGQYRVAAYLYNHEGQQAYINEVAYIYSNLTTELVDVVGADDFIDVTRITGTVQYRENGADQSGYTLAVYANPEGTGNSLASTYIYDSGSQSYTLYVPRPDKEVTLYFYISNNSWFHADDITLTANQASAEKNISVDRSTITLSGTISVTLSDTTLSSVYLYGYPAEGGGSSYDATVEGGTWTMAGIPSDFSGVLNFQCGFEYNGQWYWVNNVGSWTSGSSTTGIDLSPSLVIVSGSFTAAENGSPLSDGYVGISPYREESPGSGNFYVYLAGYFNYSWTGGTCTWTYVTAALSPEAQVELRITIGSNNDVTESITLGTTDVNIPPRAYTFTFTLLSGSIGTVTVNGQSPGYVYVYAYTPDGESGLGGMVNGTAWEIRGIPGDFTGTLTIGVVVEYNGGWYEKEIVSWTSDSSTTINLGDMSFTLYPISGTVTKGSLPLDQGWLYLFKTGTLVLSELQNQLPLGNAEITGGSFSDYVLDGMNSAYVVVVVITEGDNDEYYITPSPVTLDDSMNLNIANMNQLQL